MLTLDPTGRLYPDQRDLSRHAAERHALLTAVRTTEPAPHRRGTWLTRLTATWAVNVPAELSFLKKRT